MAPENYHDGNLDPRLKEPRNVDIAALCDAYAARTDAAKRWAPQAKTYDDFRKLLADKSIDAVIIATPDPWHAQMLILACEAGKDVYLEKPVMYRLGEAKAMIEAVRRNKRIVQIGIAAPLGGPHRRGRQDGPRRQDRRSAFRARVELHGHEPAGHAGARQRSAGRPELGRLAGALAQGALQPQPARLPGVHGLYQWPHHRLRKPPLRFGAPDHGGGYAAEGLLVGGHAQ